MSPLRFRPTFRNPFREGSLAREVDDEIAHHIESCVRDLVADGLTEEEARRRAQVRFGNRGSWRERALRERRRGRRKDRRLEMTQGLVADLRTALRRLRRRPRFALVCVAVLAMGIGSSTAVIAVLDATMFGPLPFPDQDRVVRLFGATQRFDRLTMAPANYFDLKEQATLFDALATTAPTVRTVFLEGPRRFRALLVEADFFDVVGVEPAMGRRILREDESPGASQVAVLSHEFWETELGANPAVLGSALRIGSETVTVVGIMPSRFEYPDRDSYSLILPFRGNRTSRGVVGGHYPIARLRSGVDITTADSQVKEIVARLVAAYPGANVSQRMGGELTAKVEPFRDSILFPQVRLLLLLVASVVALLLAVVWLNASGLLLAHAVSRQRELSVRAALGASRWQLIREVLTENGVLTALGLLGGIALAYPLLHAMKQTAPAGLALLDTAQVDVRVIVACVAVAGLTWLASGLGPAIAGTRPNLARALKDAARTSSPRVHWTRRTIIVGQFVLACALVSTAGALVNGYARMALVDPGFDPDELVALRFDLPSSRYSRPASPPGGAEPSSGQQSNLVRVSTESHDVTNRIVARLGAVRGVARVTAGTAPPYDSRGPGAFHLPDVLDESIPQRSKRWHRTKWVMPGYFDALRIPLLEGRTFDDGDNAGAEQVIVISRAFADWIRDEHPNPVGSVIEFRHVGPSPVAQALVVGVVANTIHDGAFDPDEAIVYAPFAQQGGLWPPQFAFALLGRTFLVRADRDAATLLPELQQAVWEIEPEVPFAYARSVASMREGTFRVQRFVLVLLGGFAVVALLLAAAGTFALLAQIVRSRHHELGVRRALGASVRDITTRVLLDGLRMSGLGVVFGLTLSFALVQMTAGRVSAVGNVAATLGVDGWAIGPQVVVILLLLGSALLASSAPAWAAGRADPVETMRVE